MDPLHLARKPGAGGGEEWGAGLYLAVAEETASYHRASEEPTECPLLS